MSVEGIKSVLEANRQVLHQALPSFKKSLVKCCSLELAEPCSFEVEESFDALTSKFSRVSDLVEIRDLRNQIAHEYLTENLNEVYQDCLDLSERLLSAIHSADPAMDRILGTI
jgi:hypothetical protein